MDSANKRAGLFLIPENAIITSSKSILDGIPVMIPATESKWDLGIPIIVKQTSGLPALAKMANLVSVLSFFVVLGLLTWYVVTSQCVGGDR